MFYVNVVKLQVEGRESSFESSDEVQTEEILCMRISDRIWEVLEFCGKFDKQNVLNSQNKN